MLRCSACCVPCVLRLDRLNEISAEYVCSVPVLMAHNAIGIAPALHVPTAFISEHIRTHREVLTGPSHSTSLQILLNRVPAACPRTVLQQHRKLVLRRRNC